jgi:DNA-binding response OmpR family regulator
VLVVDDDHHIRDMLQEALSDEGHTVRTATNGAEALDLVEYSPPLAVLLDLWMPVLDGWGFVRGLGERNISVPFVLMTASNHGQQAAEDLRASAYLAKPFNLSYVLAVVETLVTESTVVPDSVPPA